MNDSSTRVLDCGTTVTELASGVWSARHLRDAPDAEIARAVRRMLVPGADNLVLLASRVDLPEGEAGTGPVDVKDMLRRRGLCPAETSDAA